MFLVPVVGIFLKMAGNFMAGIQNPMAASNVFTLSLVFTNDLNGITTFIASVLIIGVTPAIAAITIIYATSYCIILARRQFRRLAFFNYQVSDSANNIEALQDFSNEASVFMLKLH